MMAFRRNQSDGVKAGWAKCCALVRWGKGAADVLCDRMGLSVLVGRDALGIRDASVEIRKIFSRGKCGVDYRSVFAR